jgi:hypothetical protein
VIEARRNLGTKGSDALGSFESLLATLQVGRAQAIDTIKPEFSWLLEK